MKNACYKMGLASALLLQLWLGGCVTQDVEAGASTKAVKPASGAPQLPPPSALETQHGIQVTHIGLSASGGLVDCRFKVLDAVKAKALLGNPASAPMLIAGDKPPLMAPHNALRSARFATGQVVYILYPNLRSAIQPGSQVTVAIGEVRLGPVTAQ